MQAGGRTRVPQSLPPNALVGGGLGAIPSQENAPHRGAFRFRRRQPFHELRYAAERRPVTRIVSAMASPSAAFLANAHARLARLSAELAGVATPSDVAWVLCEFAGRELDLADCVVYLLEPDGSSLAQHAAWGPKRAAHHVLESRLRLQLDQGIVGRSARLRLPQHTDDARSDPRYVVDDQFNLSELAVPIVSGDTLYGVLDSEHPQANRYDLDDEHVFLAIAERGANRLRELRSIQLRSP